MITVIQRPDDPSTLFISFGGSTRLEDVYYTIYYSPHNPSITIDYSGGVDTPTPLNFDKFMRDLGQYVWSVTSGQMGWGQMKAMLEESLERHTVISSSNLR